MNQYIQNLGKLPLKVIFDENIKNNGISISRPSYYQEPTIVLDEDNIIYNRMIIISFFSLLIFAFYIALYYIFYNFAKCISKIRDTNILNNFSINILYLFYYSFKSIISIEIIYYSYECWFNSNFSCSETCIPDIKLISIPFLNSAEVIDILYIISIASYINQLGKILFEYNRKDFQILLLHHIVTIILLFFSYFFCLRYAGFFIISMFEFSDIFIKLRNIIKYTNWKIMKIITYSIMILSFIALRLLLLPFFMIKHTINCDYKFPHEEIFLYPFIALIIIINIIWLCIMINNFFITTYQYDNNDNSKKDQ